MVDRATRIKSRGSAYRLCGCERLFCFNRTGMDPSSWRAQGGVSFIVGCDDYQYDTVIRLSRQLMHVTLHQFLTLQLSQDPSSLATYVWSMDVHIIPFAPAEHNDQVTSLWHSVLPTYKIPKSHLQDLLGHKGGRHYVALGINVTDGNVADAPLSCGTDIIGFIATYIKISAATSNDNKGYVSAVLVASSYQHQGVGTRLLQCATENLIEVEKCSTITVGSVFPRFWPGIPTDIPAPCQDFFQAFYKNHDSLEILTYTPCRDLYLDLNVYAPPDFVAQRAEEVGISFRPLTERGSEECLLKQRQNFDNEGWVAAYEVLVEKGLHDQIMVAFDSQDNQVGWTLMIEPGLPVWTSLACPPVVGDRTGLIACVGVDKQARSAGIGLALVDNAVRDLRRRGLQHVFVDWVVLEGWYEKLGFKIWRDYQTLVCNLVT